ncbi:Glycosyltransferase involved in cell wall bisynthesis [Spirosomataceae bacterium TFI 002]|nr:Glycosyltransferase involved in cell wall bisynthesis [Spirosomataceae bacterium TFI 002]
MSKRKNILFISHDGNRAGAQLLLLDAMKFLSEKGHSIHLLILEEYGTVFHEYANEFDIRILPKPKKKKKLDNFLALGSNKFSIESFIYEEYNHLDIDLIYANTIATAYIAPRIKSVLKVPLLSHIHELPYSISMYATAFDTKNLFAYSDAVIACSQAVGDNLLSHFEGLNNKTHTIHSFVDNENLLRILENTKSEDIKSEFYLPRNKKIIGGCGNAEWRKGVDVFLNIVKLASKSKIADEIHFVWIGIKTSGEYYEKLIFDVEKMGITSFITFIEPTPKAKELIASLDVFLMSSREDPFPLVMLEAALCKKPIVGFQNTGGCAEFVENDCGLLAPFLDNEVIVEHITNLVLNPELRTIFGTKAQEKVLAKYSYVKSMNAIEDLILQF